MFGIGRKSIERAADTAVAPARAAVRLGHLVKVAFLNYIEHRSAPIAAAIAFQALLSFAPLLLVVYSALGFWIKSHPDAYANAQQLLEAMLPVRPPLEIENEIQSIVRNRGIAGGIGLVGLVWLSSNVFHLLYDAIAVASGQKGGFVRSRLMGILMTFSVAVFLLVGFGLASLLALARDVARARAIELAAPIEAHWYVAESLVTVLVTGLTFTAIYKLLPPKRVRIRAALCGGFGTAIVWEVTRRLFSWYVSNSPFYASIYGSLANMVCLAVWAYYSAMLLLIGAELTFAFERERELLNAAASQEQPEDATAPSP